MNIGSILMAGWSHACSLSNAVMILRAPHEQRSLQQHEALPCSGEADHQGVIWQRAAVGRPRMEGTERGKDSGVRDELQSSRDAGIKHGQKQMQQSRSG